MKEDYTKFQHLVPRQYFKIEFNGSTVEFDNFMEDYNPEENPFIGPGLVSPIDDRFERLVFEKVYKSNALTIENFQEFLKLSTDEIIELIQEL